LDRGNLDCLLPGLTEEIIAAISCFRWITCIPTESIANSLPAPDQTPYDVDADYLLDSTLQRSGNQVRILVRPSTSDQVATSCGPAEPITPLSMH